MIHQATGGLDPDPPDPGAVALGIAPGALLVLCVVLAVLLARRDRRHRTVAQALVVLAGAMTIRLGLHALVLHGGPYTGGARVAFHIEEGLRLLTACVPAWLAWTVLVRPSRPLRVMGVAAVLVVGAWATLMVAYPEVRGERLRLCYLAVELLSLLGAAVAIQAWARRRGAAGDGAARAHTWASVLMIVAADALLLFVGGWPLGLFGAAYVAQQAGLLALYLGLFALHIVALRTAQGPRT